MSKQVEKVTESFSKIGQLGEKAERIAAHLEESVAGVDEALDIAQEQSQSLRNTGAALRGLLGVQTNRPPATAKIAGRTEIPSVTNNAVINK